MNIHEVADNIKTNMIHHFKVFTQVSVPAGCAVAYMDGMTLNMRNVLSENGATLDRVTCSQDLTMLGVLVLAGDGTRGNIFCTMNENGELVYHTKELKKSWLCCECDFYHEDTEVVYEHLINEHNYPDEDAAIGQEEGWR